VAKSFQDNGYTALLISNSSALSQTPAKAAGPWTWDQCIAGASKGNPSNAKCVMEILRGEGTKIGSCGRTKFTW